jgi:hypothetical protein
MSTLNLAVMGSVKHKGCYGTLKEPVEHINFKSVGRQLHALGAATENALSPNVTLVLGMT